MKLPWNFSSELQGDPAHFKGRLAAAKVACRDAGNTIEEPIKNSTWASDPAENQLATRQPAL
jgi:hypothetical protein